MWFELIWIMLLIWLFSYRNTGSIGSIAKKSCITTIEWYPSLLELLMKIVWPIIWLALQLIAQTDHPWSRFSNFDNLNSGILLVNYFTLISVYTMHPYSVSMQLANQACWLFYNTTQYRGKMCNRHAGPLCPFHILPLQNVKCTRMQKLHYQ